jgi:hypothetical protein
MHVDTGDMAHIEEQGWMFLRSGCVRLIGHSTTFQKEVAAMNTVKKGCV